MQFQVPQFIETEDKIVGPLSLRQFIIVGAGAGVAGVLYFVIQTWLWLILAIILVGGAIGIAFIKIEGRSLPKIIMSAFNFYWSPQIYVWQPDHPVLPKATPHTERPLPPLVPVRKKVAAGEALHKHWEDLQTGEKMSAGQFAEQKMNQRYQIFQRISGEREAARRVDYR